MTAPTRVADSGRINDEEAWWFLDTLVVRHHLATAAAPVVLEMTLPAGAAPPLHVHLEYDDSSYLLEGEMVVRTADDLRLARPGDWLSTPRGVAHAFRVVGDRPARILAIQENEDFLQLIRELAESAVSRALPPPGHTPASDDVFRSFAAHDTAVIGPSLSDHDARSFLATRC